MRFVLPPVLAIVRSPSLLSDIMRVVGREAVRQCIGASEIRSGAADESVRLIVYETGAWTPDIATELIAELFLAQPRARILVCWRGDSFSVAEMTNAVASLATAIPVHGTMTLGSELLRGMSGAIHGGIAAPVLRWLRDETPARRSVDHCVAASLILSSARYSVRDLANAVIVSPRALSRHCQTTKLPRPVVLLGWARALHVVARLENGASLQEIAMEGGESSARECSDYVRYHTGRAPTVWVATGGLATLIAEFTTTVMAPGRARHLTLLSATPASHVPSGPSLTDRFFVSAS
jgi:hypothetical protein